MENIKLLKVGLFQVNCALVRNPGSDTLYIIDPGGDPDDIVDAANSFACKQHVILLTHAHVDHISGVSETARRLGISRIYLHPGDHPMYTSPNNALPPYIPAAENLPSVIWPLEDPEITVIPCPGHTPGGTAYLFKPFRTLFSGDTIFRVSIGRTDLGGNFDTLMNSIRTNISTLPEDTRIIPGHGPETTVGYENKHNPYLVGDEY